MIIYGKNPIKEAIYAKRKIYKLYLEDKTNDKELLTFLCKYNIEYEVASKQQLNILTKNALHQGIVADVSPYQYSDLDEVLVSNQKLRFLILDEINDPHNLGAIIRSAEATKLSGIIISKKNQVGLTATVAKVSSGAIEHVKIILVTNIRNAITKLQASGFLVIGTDISASSTYKEIPQDEKIAVLMGSEGKGIRPLLKKACDLLVKIPMYGKVNSLNVSVSAALILYEITLKGEVN